jgi:hypothetical protein
MSNENEIQDDYDFARSKYYNLAEKGDEAIDLMLDLARESEHPRAFEVLSNMIKQNAEVADRLMELQKKTKDVRNTEDQQKQLPNSMTQNNVYVGSTTDLQRMLHNKIDQKAKTIDQTDNDYEDDED